jgi:hypothetical protein
MDRSTKSSLEAQVTAAEFGKLALMAIPIRMDWKLSQKKRLGL